MLRLENLNKYFFRRKSNEIHVINNTTLEFNQSGLVALLGPSGCGKTTLLNVIGGLDKVNSGNVYVNGQKITGRRSGKVDEIRNLNIGYIFQNYNLIDSMTVFDNVAMVLKMVGIKDKAEIKEKVEYALDLVGMYRYRNRYADMLSGGERQRVGIARAIVKNPAIIIADEPTGNLDSKNTLEVMNIIKAISKEKLVILVTHEDKLAQFYCDRIIRLRDGEVVSDEDNNHSNGLDYKVENQIYLKDLKKHDALEKDGYNINIYNDGDAKIDLDIVIKEGNLFIKNKEAFTRVELVDQNSSIEFIDDHYKELTKEEQAEYVFDGEKLKARKPLKHSSIYNPATMLKQGFKTVANYSILKKILLVGFFLAAAFMTYGVANIAGVLDIHDGDFVDTNKDYLRIMDKDVTLEEYQAIENSENVQYALPGNGNATFIMKYDEYFQTCNTEAYMKGSITDINTITEDDLTAGRMPTSIYELVVDELVLEKMDTWGEVGAAGYECGEDLLGKTVKINNMPDFTIVGITDKEQPCIYAYPDVFVNIFANSQSEEDMWMDDGMAYGEDPEEAVQILDYTLKQDEIVLKQGHMPTADYEVIVNYSHKDDWKINKEINQKVNGHKLMVVGYYTSETSLDTFLVNNNTVKYQTILNSDSVTILPTDEEAAKAEFEATGKNVVDTYDEARKTYVEDHNNLVKVSLILALIILLISIIEIILIIRASFLSRIKEVGTLRAIGVKKTDIYRMFLGEIIAIVTFSAVPGFICMEYVSYQLMHISYFEEDFLVNPFVALVSIVLIFAVNILFGLLPVFKTLRKKPAAILARTDIN